MARDLGERYGEGVAVEYLDVYSPEMFGKYSDILRLIATRRVGLPVVAIAGKARFAGGISTQMICEALELLGLKPVNLAGA